MSELTDLRQHCQRRKTAMREELNDWLPDWRQISEYIDPARGRFNDKNDKPYKRNRAKIINSKATEVLRVMTAGMTAHMTSKAQPWFKLATPDAQLSEQFGVRVWLDDVAQLIRDTLAKSNFYKAMPVVYTEDGMFGVAPMLVLQDNDEVVRFYSLTAGTYAVGLDDQGRVDSIWRCYKKTARQLKDRYGEEKLPVTVRQALQQNGDQKFTVESLVEKNPDARPGMGPLGLQAPKYRPYREVVWIEGQQADGHGILDIGGHYEAPFVVARWNPVAEDIYSASPALDCLGDIKQLQYLEGEKLRLIDLLSQPPLALPESMRNKGGASLAPGAKTYLPDDQQGAKAEVIYQPNYAALQQVREEIRTIENRIENSFFYNLFLMLQQLGDQTGRTAYEIAQRREEKAAVLGPTLESLTDEVLDPVVVRVYRLLERAGRIPEAPEALDSVPLKIEYTSILAQAQRANSSGTIERAVQFIGGLAQATGSPDVLDKLDADQTVDVYTRGIDVPASMIRSDDAVASIREARAQQQRMAQIAQMAPALKDGAQAAKAASDAVPQDGSIAQTLGSALAGAAQ
ncbi:MULTISPECIES: portal protein [unclassified Xanthomonas]|uniref:portal protein n=1 Tax=unclassified Xanthomonas TaxID=2643310 RepID=UPI002A80563F|nr:MULTISPECIES: portal protein [unclassified Xanthomonas]MDY4297524.1 portal protein [Xanthomonas sp. LF02-5]MDY4359318.1 portal protein [Xanthomonas sp. LF04-12]